MKVIFGDRRSGKTTRLVEMANKTPNAIILTHNRLAASLIMEHVKVAEHVKFYTYTMSWNKLRSSNSVVFIDDIDIFLRWVFRGSDIGAITVPISELEKELWF